MIIIDGGAVSLEERMILEEGLLGVTLIDMSGSLGRFAAQRGLQLAVEDGRVGVAGRSKIEWLGTADSLSIGEADALARWVAPFRITDTSINDDEPLTGSTELVDMLGIGNPSNLLVDRVWRPRTIHDRLRIPIGVGPNGEPVELDIKEAAQGGMGPHGLVIGATGSGKSELLRTIVLGLAITHSPVGAEPDPGRLQGRRDVPRAERVAAHRRGDHQPAGRPQPGRPHV